MDILAYQFKEEIRMLIREEIAVNTSVIEPPKQIAEIVNQKGLCDKLGLSEPTIIRWRNKGKIPFMKVGSAIRYDVNEVVRALEVGSTKGRK